MVSMGSESGVAGEDAVASFCSYHIETPAVCDGCADAALMAHILSISI